MKIETQPTFSEIITQLNVVTERLKDAPAGDCRRALLKEFRELLEEVERITDSRN